MHSPIFLLAKKSSAPGLTADSAEDQPTRIFKIFLKEMFFSENRQSG
jgi:hypothetical protein